MEGCIFCSIVQGKTPTYKVFETQQFIVALDINAATKGHLVVIPKAHYKHIIEMPEQEYQSLFSLARVLMITLIDYGAKGANILYSLGESAGQRSPHMILHVIPRYENDKVHLVWEPQKLSEADFKAIQSAIASRINAQVSSGQQPRQEQQLRQEQQPRHEQQPQQPAQPQLPPPPLARLPRRTGGY